MIKNYFINLHRQNITAARSRCRRVAFFVSFSLELLYRIVWGTGNSPEGSAVMTLTARNAVFLLSKLKFQNYGKLNEKADCTG